MMAFKKWVWRFSKVQAAAATCLLHTIQYLHGLGIEQEFSPCFGFFSVPGIRSLWWTLCLCERLVMVIIIGHSYGLSWSMSFTSCLRLHGVAVS